MGVFDTSNRWNGLEELDNILEFANIDTKLKVRNIIDNYVDDKLKKLSRTQLIDIPAHCLVQGDIIFDLQRKYIQRVEYVSPYDATSNNGRHNTIMICYGENYDCDNVAYYSTVTILVDISDYAIREVENPKEEE